jgi:murein DD-endopeptidase MepM/ murein hydrolase activator NlpD
MSSLHQDHLLVEGPEPVKGTGSIPATTARGTLRKPVEEKATTTVRTPRQGKSQTTGTTPTTPDASVRTPRTRRTAGSKAAAAAAGTLAARAKAARAATGKVAAATAATAKGATVTAASAKAATAKAATVRAVTGARSAAAAKRAAASKAAASKAPAPKAVAPKSVREPAAPAAEKATVAKPLAAKPATAKPATAKPVAAKPAAATAATAKATAAELVAARAATAARRPTPYKRTAVELEHPVATEVEGAQLTATDVASTVADSARFLRRRPPVLGRRPALYLAAALVGALGVTTFSSGEPAAQATSTVSHSVSVAEELGIEAAPSAEITAVDATQRLGELAVSRNVRGAEQAAAAEVQAQADQAAAAAAAAAAAEAARPKAVLPVDGARLTSGFGSRWGTLHAGIDLAAPMRTPEYAAMDGVVLKAGAASGYGLVVYIQHENGDVTVYGHMDSILVEEGQVVRAGDTIALLGNRGQSTGPHLHFEVHVGGMNGEKIDPLPWLRERGIDI